MKNLIYTLWCTRFHAPFEWVVDSGTRWAYPAGRITCWACKEKEPTRANA